jgi:SAM-dependent methyltransferase
MVAMAVAVCAVDHPSRSAAQTAAPQTQASGPSAVETIRREGKALAPLFSSELVKQFLAATADLPEVSPRVAYRDEATRQYYAEAEAAALPEEARKSLQKLDLDDSYYYNTRYGTPLAYARPLEVLSKAGLTGITGRKLLDFGYGSVGHLRLLAGLGADVVGVEVDPLLKILYGGAGDQGPIKGRLGRDGSVTLLHGQFPADPGVAKAAGEGYDLIISKNVLKNGYIHPEQPVDPKRLVHLGVDEETFVAALHRALKPGGRVMIYNLCPAPAPPGKPYIPWADGRSPFPESLWIKAGFKLIAFDRDDSAAARAMGHALGWDQGDSPMDLEKDLFALYTLTEKS